MTNEAVIRPRQFSLRVAFLLLAVIGLLCALIIRPLVSLDRSLKSEYRTVRVIQMVKRYVLNHGGKWPRSWADLGQGGNSRYAKYTRINFDLKSEDLLKDRRMIHSAITPATGKFIIYPNADRDLDDLLETISASTAAAQCSPVSTSAPVPSTGDHSSTPGPRS